MTDHLQTVNQLVEYPPLALAFNEHRKAFDSIITSKMLKGIQVQGVEPIYINVL